MSVGQQTTQKLMEVLFQKVERQHNAARLTGGDDTAGSHNAVELRQLEEIYKQVQDTANVAGGHAYASLANVEESDSASDSGSE